MACPVLREHSPAADARGSTGTAHFPAKISYTTPRDTICGPYERVRPYAALATVVLLSGDCRSVIAGRSPNTMSLSTAKRPIPVSADAER